MTLAELKGEITALVSRHAVLLVLVVGGQAAFDTALTFMFTEGFAAVASTIVDVAVGYGLLLTLMQREELIERTGGFGSYFAVYLLTGLGMAVGLILLIIPGLVLAARWMIAPLLVLGRASHAGAALTESWVMTRDSTTPLTLAIIIGVVLPLALLIAAMILMPPVESWWIDLAENLMIDSIPVATTCLSLAAYRLLAMPSGRVSEVFA